MPTYDYLCDECNHGFEKFQQMSASPLKKCPECGKMKLKRLIGTGAGIIFKGSGFYETDYRSDSYQKGSTAAKNDSSKNSKSESKTTKKNETKPKAKKADKPKS